jgi:hypothetical protein
MKQIEVTIDEYDKIMNDIIDKRKGEPIETTFIELIDAAGKYYIIDTPLLITKKKKKK